MKERIYPLIPTIIIVAILYLVSRQIDSNLIQGWIESAGILAPLFLVLLAVLASVVAPISGTPLLFVGFIIYGPRIVFLLTISSLISAAINFHISRKWGRPFIKRFVGGKNMATVDRFTTEHGATSLLFLRIFMGSLNDFISYAIGLTNMKFQTYYLITFAGVVPGTIIWYLIAANSKSPLSFTLYTMIFMAIFSGIYLLYKFAVSASKQIKS